MPIPDSPRPRRRGNRGVCGRDLELPLSWSPPNVERSPVRRPVRSAGAPCPRERAQWWFAQMRRVVASGEDFHATGVF